jgi:hypothetical protein
VKWLRKREAQAIHLHYSVFRQIALAHVIDRAESIPFRSALPQSSAKTSRKFEFSKR